MSESGQNKRLKQAQLHFTAKKQPTEDLKPSKSDHVKGNALQASEEDKENVPANNKHVVSPKVQKVKPELNVLTIDLTDEKSRDSAVDEMMVTEECTTSKNQTAKTSKMSEAMNRSIDEVIEDVVRRASDEYEKTAGSTLTPKGNVNKKRHRSKSASPEISSAKRPVLSQESAVDGPKYDKPAPPSFTKDVPVITVTAPTPTDKSKSSRKRCDVLHSYFEALKNKTQNEPKAESKGSDTVVEHAPVEQGSAKKRRRSGSPTPVQGDVIKSISDQGTSVTPSKKIKQYKSDDESPVSSKTPSRVTDVDKVRVVSKVELVMANDNVTNDSESSSPGKCDVTLISSDEEDDSQTSFQSPPPSKHAGLNLKETPSPSNGNSVTPKSLTKSGSKKPKTPNPEVLRRREEKEREREAKRKQREEQRLVKEKEKIEQKRKKDEEKAQKEEEKKRKREAEELLKAEKQKEKEEKQKEKEQRDLEKKLEKERKEEERRKEKEKKEEEKRHKDLERQKIEEEKHQAEEEKRRKSEKRAETFKSFFKSPARSPSVKKVVAESEKIAFFAPFQPKANMVIAPTQRVVLDSLNKKALDVKLNTQDSTVTYFEKVGKKSRGRRSLSSVPKFRGRHVSLSEDGLEIVDDADSKPGTKTLRAKFLMFHVNYRPPYYGTWRKTSKHISPRNPFKQDKELLDYEFDSDDEWEDPGEGEDIDNSDGEDEADGNEEDEDDGFFVPHGYLSDDEGINENDEEMPKPDHKLKQKQLEFEASFKRKLQALTPVVIGCVWKDSAESLNKAHQQMLDNYKVEILADVPIEVYPSKKAEDGTNSNDNTPKSDAPKKAHGLRPVPEEAMPDLIRLLHGNALSLSRIVNEFQEYWTLKQASNGEPLTCGPLPLEEDPEGEGMEDDESAEATATPTTQHVADGHTAMQTSPVGSAQSSPAVKEGKKGHAISKTQLMKRCKEIAAYLKKENINRQCWFVHDSVRENYSMDNGKAPVPCKWRFVTEVPKIQILIFPQSSTKLAAPTDASKPQTATPSPVPGNNIDKFVSKVSACDILQRSYQKYEQEKQLVPQAVANPAATISKYATDKVSPLELIEKSAQKIAEDLAAKSKREEQMVVDDGSQSASNLQPREGVYIIPTPDAIRTLFKIDDQNQSPEPAGSGMDCTSG